jgi:hypothetical protein
MHSIFRFITCLILTVAVFAGTISARTIHLAPNGSDNAECAAGAVFATLERAVQCLAPGDTLLIANGVYSGGAVVTLRSLPEAPLVIRGQSLDAVIEGSGNQTDALRIQECSHVILEKLTVRKSGRAGLAVRFSDHVRVADCLLTNNEVWGIFTSFADDLTIENIEACSSKVQHGIYHSNSGDRFVIRGNHVHHNNGNGIHMNGDPEIAGGDGILNEGLVERNLVHHNGAAGGGAINMTHVHDIIVRNNLLHHNRANSVTIYQDTGTFEQGSKRVLVTGNTIHFAPGQGRSGINIQETSEKVVITGNIFVSGGSRGNLQVESEHLSTIISDYNLFWGVDQSVLVEQPGDKLISLDQWRTLSGNDMHSRLADPLFGDIAGFDFMPADSSPAIDAAAPLDSVRAMVASLEGTSWLLAALDSLAAGDFDGNSRPMGEAPDIGAYEFHPSLESMYDFNGDNQFSIADALALLMKGLRNPGNMTYDIDRDGQWGLADVVTLVRIMIANSSAMVVITGGLDKE